MFESRLHGSLSFSQVSGMDGETWAQIPQDKRETIRLLRERVKEISGKLHTVEDTYSVYKDCDKDLHEAAVRLTNLDTFHTVPSKRDRKKEKSLKATQGRRGNDGRRNGCMNYSSSDANGGRYTASKLEHGAGYVQKSSKFTFPAPEKKINNVASDARRASDRPSSLSSGATYYKHEGTAVDAAPKRGRAANVQVHAERPASSKSIAFNSVRAPNLSHRPSAIGITKTKLGAEVKMAESKHNERIRLIPQDIDPETPTAAEKDRLNEIQTLSTSGVMGVISGLESLGSISAETVVENDVATNSGKANSRLFHETDVADGPHLSFPLDFRVSEALKSGLTFGSFDSSLVMGLKRHGNDTGEGKSPHAQSYQMNEKTEESSLVGNGTTANPSSSPSETSTVEGDNYIKTLPPRVPQSHDNPSPDEPVKREHLRQQESVISENHQMPGLPNLPTYDFGLMPSLLDNKIAQSEINATQAQTGSSGSLQSSNLTTTGQNFSAASQQLVSVFQQPYPPSFFSYGPSPLPYIPVNIHQLAILNGLFQQSYVPPVAATGFKLPIPEIKREANTGNSVPFGIPPAYGSSNGVANHSQTLASLSSVNNRDTLSPQSENNINLTGQLNESLPRWLSAHGTGLSGLQVNALYNIPLQGQPMPFSAMQVSQGGLGGMIQTMTAPAGITNQALRPWLPLPKQ